MRAKLAVGLILLLTGTFRAWQADQRISPGFGAIEGLVVDGQTGEPVSNATVIVEPDDVVASGKPISTVSDPQGKFYVNDIPPGKYVIPAAKEEENYPNADNAAFAAELNTLPRVLVREGQVTRGVVVRIEKGGKLLGMVLDAQTGQPVVTSRIRLTRVDDPRLWIEAGPDASGHFQFVIPARPFRLVVSAPGYRIWSFSGNGSQAESGVLLLKPESTQNITVALEKNRVSAAFSVLRVSAL